MCGKLDGRVVMTILVEPKLGRSSPDLSLEIDPYG